MDLFATSYISLNLAIGVGIAVDAMVATVARFRHFREPADALKWAGAIGITHWLFPFAGFAGGYLLNRNFDVEPLVYGLSAAIMFVFIAYIFEEEGGLSLGIVEALGKSAALLGKPFVAVLRAGRRVLRLGSPPNSAPGAGRRRSPRMRFWLAVMAVSMDAIIAGPGKTAATAHWTPAQVIYSFPLVGGIVFLLVLASVYPAITLFRQLQSPDGWIFGKSGRTEKLGRYLLIGFWLETTIFLFFGYLAIREALAAAVFDPGWMTVFGAAGITSAALWMAFGDRVARQQRREASELMEGEDPER